MFGLMKAKTCSLADELKHHRRLHYCGTCKTMGSLYGQKTRALLNHDTVFLAEVLTAISADNESLRGWNRAYQSFNCLTLPKTVEAMPVALQLAATATVVLTEFKLADHISDSKSAVWKSARRFFSKSFRQAEAKLKEWQFPLADLQRILESQQAREAAALATNTTADELLHNLAEPTATATAMFFQHGARLVGRVEFAEEVYEIGFAFGELAYLLDAFEDYDKDFRKGEFNALRVAYKLADAQLPAESRRNIMQRLRRLGVKIQCGLLDLPMPEAMAAMYTTRLQTNLANRLGGLPLLPIHHAHGQACASRLSIKERWRNAVRLGRGMVTRYRDAHAASLTAKLSAPLIFASVLPVAFFAPQQANTANSYRECLSLGFNLMFLGSVAASTAAMANSFFFTADGPHGGAGGQPPPPGWQGQPPGQPPPPPSPPTPPKQSTCDQCGDICCCGATCCECVSCCDC